MEYLCDNITRTSYITINNSFVIVIYIIILTYLVAILLTNFYSRKQQKTKKFIINPNIAFEQISIYKFLETNTKSKYNESKQI